jgi:DNA polymerase-3 subunit beta
LGVRYVRDLPDSGDLSVIVQGKPLSAMYGVLRGCTSVRLAVNERQSHLLLDTEAGCWHLRLIEGQFPDFNRIIPQETPFTCLVDRAELLAAVKLVAPVAADNSQITRLTAVDGVLTVSAAADNQTAETTVSIEPVRGGSMVWALNNKYLRDSLDAVDDVRVTVNVAGPKSPTVLHGDNRSVGVQVVMAMHDAKAATS